MQHAWFAPPESCHFGRRIEIICPTFLKNRDISSSVEVKGRPCTYTVRSLLNSSLDTGPLSDVFVASCFERLDIFVTFFLMRLGVSSTLCIVVFATLALPSLFCFVLFFSVASLESCSAVAGDVPRRLLRLISSLILLSNFSNFVPSNIILAK